MALRRIAGASLVLVGFATLAVPSMRAQEPVTSGQEPVISGLFGPDASRPSGHQAFDFFLSGLHGYDTDVVPNAVAPEAADSGAGVAGNFTALQGRLGYFYRTPRSTLDLSGSGAVRNYPTIGGLQPTGYFGGASYSLALSPRTTLAAHGSAAYTQTFDLGVLPGAPGAGDSAAYAPDYTLYKRPEASYVGDLSVAYRLTPRARLSLDGMAKHTAVTTDDYSIDERGGGGTFSYGVGHDAALVLGYHYRQADSRFNGTTTPFQSHDVLAGLEYRGTLSARTRTTWGFSTGTTIIRAPLSIGSSDTRSSFNVAADAFLETGLGSNWTGRFSYSRGSQFLEGFAQPLFRDSVMANLTGLVHRRVTLRASAGYSAGQVGLLTEQRFNLFNGAGNVQFALTRTVAWYGEYLYYHYVFDQGVVLPPGVLGGLGRQSVRTGVTIWLPVYRAGGPAPGVER